MDDLSKQLSSAILDLSENQKHLFARDIFQALRTPKGALCWCKSGRKHENCHLGRSDLRKINRSEERNNITRIFNNKKYCSAIFDKDNCVLPIKGAHTIQRGRVLSSITKDGHVGTFYRNEHGFEDPSFIKTGMRRNASVFYGFCNFHDTELFKEIEQNEFTRSAENCWASSYRAVCHEHFQKNAAMEAALWQSDNLDKGYTLTEQVLLQKKLQFHRRDILKGFKDVSKIKKQYELAKTKNDFGLISSYVITLDNPLCLAVCGSVSPFYNIDKVRIQNVGNPNDSFQHFAVSTVTIDGSAAYVISYLREHTIIKKYLKEVFSRGEIYVKSWLMKSIFAYTENCFFDLDWWSNLRPTKQESIYELAMSENYMTPFTIDNMVSKEIPGEIISITEI